MINFLHFISLFLFTQTFVSILHSSVNGDAAAENQAAAAAAVVYPPPKRCNDPNEVWDTEQGSHCQATCANPQPAKCYFFVAVEPGCRCKPGYVLENGKCQHENECPNPCKDPNEVWDTNQGSICQATCADRNPRPCPTLAPARGCRCKPGYVLENGTCLEGSKCPAPQKCPRYEVYDGCHHGCEPSCERPDTMCTLQCGPGGCRCQQGYIRYQGKCIPKKQCPPKKCPAKKCPRYEVYDECYHGCENTCANRKTICTEQCGPGGCRCQKNYLRHKGKCVLESKCPAAPSQKKCPASEEWSASGRQCEPTCSNPTLSLESCSVVPTPPGVDISGCRCKSGYVRFKGRCVKDGTCQKCGPNERYDKCYHDCEDSCAVPNQACTKICAPGGCQCDYGYVRAGNNSAGEKCVPVDSCKNTYRGK